jgi:Tol biopolymer transport system component
VYAQGPNGIWQVAGSGGKPSVLIELDPSKGEVAQEPQILDGKAVLFTLRSGAGTTWNDAQIVVQLLDTGERRVVVNGGSDGRYLPTGHIAYSRDGVALALTFDVQAMSATGGPTPILENVRDTSATGAVGPAIGAGAAQFTTSLTGLLAYVPGEVAAVRKLVWVDREGREEPVADAPTRAYVYPAISPDGARVALDIRDQERDIWVWDFARTTLGRVTADPGADITPRWTPDGRRIVFSSDRSGQLNLFWQTADGTGTAEQLSMSSNIEWPLAVSPDGTRLLYSAQEPRGEYDLAVLLVPDGRRVQPLTDTDSFDERNGTVSPDGVWIAYESNESGRFEIYVSPFPDVKSSRHLISTDGGTRPTWARSGGELFYVSARGALMAVPVRITSTLVTGKPVPLFEMSYFRGLAGRTYDVSSDGQRFLMIKDADVDTSAQIIIVENWLNELERLVPMK